MLTSTNIFLVPCVLKQSSESALILGIFAAGIFAAGIPGDGRCLFRSVVHGASLRAGKPCPSESLQKELADLLRTEVHNLIHKTCKI